MAPSVSESQISQDAKVERQNINRELVALRVGMSAAKSLTAGTPARKTIDSVLNEVYFGSETKESKTLWEKGSVERETDMELAGLKVALAVAEELVAGTYKANVLKAARTAAYRSYLSNPTSTNQQESGPISKAITTAETHPQNSDVSKPKEITSPPSYSP